MIDYKLIDDSIKYYENFHFTRIESPWTVSKYADDLTRPLKAQPFELVHNGKRLVASGEQSFMYLYLKEFLPKGKFQTVTPCFRYDSFDFLHTKYFIKNELIITDTPHYDYLYTLVEICYDFFKKYFNKNHLKIIDEENGFDIKYCNQELGSYGIRENDFIKYIYGTGCAEPRTSNLLKWAIIKNI